MGSQLSDLNDEGYWIPLCGFRDLVMFKKDQILVLICIGLMIQLGKSSPSTRYAAESEMKGHPPMIEESSDSTASGADREKQQFFDFYVQPGYKPKPHYVQPKNTSPNHLNQSTNLSHLKNTSLNHPSQSTNLSHLKNTSLNHLSQSTNLSHLKNTSLNHLNQSTNLSQAKNTESMVTIKM